MNSYSYLINFIGILLLSFNINTYAYQSTYDLIQWEQRGDDKKYCIDITDENFNIYPGLQAVACGDDMYEFSPRYYVQYVLKGSLPEGTTFFWRVWSQNGYGGNGFEGKVTVGSDCGSAYRSDSEKVQWGCRFQDNYYCIDLFDNNWNPVKKPFLCGDNLHAFDTTDLNQLNLSDGLYHWKVWSERAYAYDTKPQRFFEGSFQYATQAEQTESAPIPACENIAGSRNLEETTTIRECLGTYCNTTTGKITNTLNIKQNGCHVWYDFYVNGLRFERQGTVDKNKVRFSGKAFESQGLNTCSIDKNSITAEGVVVNNKLNLSSKLIVTAMCDSTFYSMTGNSSLIEK